MSPLMDWQIVIFFPYSAKNYKAGDYAGEVKNGKLKVKKGLGHWNSVGYFSAWFDKKKDEAQSINGLHIDIST